MLDAIRNGFNDYVHALPRNIPKAAFESGIYSFAISALISGNVDIGLATGALAAIVSVVSGLTMPFFREAFADRRGNIKWYHQAISMIVNLGVAQLCINSLTAYRINLLAGAFFTIGLNLFLHGFHDRSTNKSPTYIMA